MFLSATQRTCPAAANRDERGPVREEAVILHAVQTFVAEPDAIFRFFEDAHNLERITPATLSFRILTPGPIEMGEGTTIDYALRVNGIPVRWRSGITAYEPGRRFIDRQLRGPYRKWVHEHRFVGRDGVTEVHDRVEYEVPGPAFVERWLVRPQLRKIFEHRQTALSAVFPQRGSATVTISEDDAEGPKPVRAARKGAATAPSSLSGPTVPVSAASPPPTPRIP